jgi:hypothetical protein
MEPCAAGTPCAQGKQQSQVCWVHVTYRSQFVLDACHTRKPNHANPQIVPRMPVASHAHSQPLVSGSPACSTTRHWRRKRGRGWGCCGRRGCCAAGPPVSCRGRWRRQQRGGTASNRCEVGRVAAHACHGGCVDSGCKGLSLRERVLRSLIPCHLYLETMSTGMPLRG